MPRKKKPFKKKDIKQVWVSEDFRKVRDGMAGELGIKRTDFTTGVSQYLRNNKDSFRNFMKCYKDQVKKEETTTRKSLKSDEELFKIRF